MLLPLVMPGLIIVFALVQLYGESGLVTKTLEMVFRLNKPLYHFSGLNGILLLNLLEQGINYFNEDFSEYIPVENLSKLQQVSASIGVIRTNKDFVECFVLGDVEISLKRKGQPTEVLTNDKIKPFDQQIIELMLKNKNRLNECVFKGFRE